MVLKKALATVLFAFILTACDKDETHHPCFNESLVHDDACTTDCPGFEGCDGKTYCNACEAARNGIGPK